MPLWTRRRLGLGHTKIGGRAGRGATRLGNSVTVNKIETEHRPHSRASAGVLLDDLAHALRQITCAGAPDDMIQTTLHAVYDICRASRVSFKAPDRHVCVPNGRPRGKPANASLSFPVPSVAPPATISIDLPRDMTLQPDIVQVVHSLVATLGAALARADRGPLASRAATLAAGNTLSEKLTQMRSPNDVRECVVEWIGAYFNAEQCLLFDADPDPVRFPGVRPAAHTWSRPGAGPLPTPAQLVDERNIAGHLFMTRMKIDSRPAAVLAVLRDAGQASWSAAERDLASHLASVVEQHLIRANRQCNAMHRSRSLQAVQQITAAASGASDRFELCRLVHDAVRSLIHHDAFLIALRPPENDTVTMIYRAEGATVFPQRTAIPQIVSAMELGCPLVIDDVVDDAVSHNDRFGDPDKRVRSIVSAPMMSKGAAIGLIVAQSYEPGFYSWETADLLQSIALSVVGTFERLMLLEQIERQTRRDIGLRNVAERLGPTLDTEELIAIASGVIFDTVTSDLVMVLVIDRQTNRVRSASYRSVNLDFEPPPAGHVMRRQSLTFSAIESANQIVELDYDDSPYASAEKLPCHHPGPFVATPIPIDQLHAGVILLARRESDSFATDDLSLMRQIAAMLSTALQNTIAHAERLRHTNDLIELQRISSTIASQLDLQKSLDEIVQAAPRLVEADSCAVGMLDGPDLVRVAANGALAMAIPVRVPVEQLMVQEALRSTEPIVMTDLRAFPIAPGATVLPIPDTRGWLGMPLIDPDGEPVGIISLMTDEPRVWSERDRSLLATLASSAALAIQNARHFERTRDLLTASVESLAAAVEAKDQYTQNHSRQVARYAKRIAEALELDGETIGHVELAGLLHDVGKIGIPDSVLEKPGPLDGAEWAAMQLHPVIGEQILAGNPILKPLLAMVRHHHERWDGHGYPDSLRGDTIPLGASIISLAEALDTMTSQRPYRAAYGWEESLEEILSCSGAQFAPHVVAALMVAIECGAFDEDVQRLLPAARAGAGTQQPRSQPLDVRALRIFDAVAQEIRSGTDLTTFISRIVSTLNKVLDVSFVALYLADDDSDERELKELVSNSDGETKPNHRVPFGRGIIGWVAEHGLVQNVSDISSDSRFVEGSALRPNRSELSVPLIAEGQVIGVLNLESDRPGAFSDMDERLLQSTVDHLANAIHVIRLHERLKTLAVTDSLTGLDNHRAFFDRLVLEIERAAESGAELSIAILDVNSLKAVNDTYGHLTGDAALKAVAGVLARHRHEGAVACRYGGDEFALILPGTGGDEAWLMLDQISAELRSGEFEIDDLTFPLPTTSWGISTYLIDGRRPIELLSSADERMYLHKQTARP